jgi:hypothetical protein
LLFEDSEANNETELVQQFEESETNNE